MKRILLLAGIAAAGGAQAVVVDTFSVSYFQSISSGTWVDVQAGPVLSGERDVELAVLSNPFSQYLDVDIPGSGALIVDNGFQVKSTVTLQYDGKDEVGNTGSGKTLTNTSSGTALVGGTDNVLRLHWFGNDLDVDVTLKLWKNGVLVTNATQTRLAGSGAGTMDFIDANVASADNVTLVFAGVPSADFALAKIETVPEPATLAALLMGAGAMAARRRKR